MAMDILQKIKTLDFNSLAASVISTLGALFTTDSVQVVYILMAVTGQAVALVISWKKESLNREKTREEILTMRWKREQGKEPDEKQEKLW